MYFSVWLLANQAAIAGWPSCKSRIHEILGSSERKEELIKFSRVSDEILIESDLNYKSISIKKSKDGDGSVCTIAVGFGKNGKMPGTKIGAMAQHDGWSKVSEFSGEIKSGVDLLGLISWLDQRGMSFRRVVFVDVDEESKVISKIWVNIDVVVKRGEDEWIFNLMDEYFSGRDGLISVYLEN